MSQARFHLTLVDRETGRTTTYEANTIVAALSMPHPNRAEIWQGVFRAEDDETVGKSLAFLCDRAFARGGMVPLEAMSRWLNRRAAATSTTDFPEGEADA